MNVFYEGKLFDEWLIVSILKKDELNTPCLVFIDKKMHPCIFCCEEYTLFKCLCH